MSNRLQPIQPPYIRDEAALSLPDGLQDYPLKIYGHKGNERLLKPILSLIPDNATSFLDLFAGTGVVAWAVKQRGTQVMMNDIRRFPCLRHRALVTNNRTILSKRDLDRLRRRKRNAQKDAREMYEHILGRRNAKFLDTWASNIPQLRSKLKREIAIFVPVVCLLKHMRYPVVHFSPTGDMTGNKDYCGIDLERDVIAFATDIMPNLLHDNGAANRSYNMDALDLVGRLSPDVTYVDSPYCTAAGDYEGNYAFFDDMVRIVQGKGREIRSRTDNKADLPPYNNFLTRQRALTGFASIFRRAHQVPLIILSYNTTSDVHPDEIADIAQAFGRDVEIQRISYRLPTVHKKSSGRLDRTEEVLLSCRRRGSVACLRRSHDEKMAA